MAVEKIWAKIVALCFLFCECFYLGFGFCLWKLDDNLFFNVSNLGKHNLFWGFDPNYERAYPCGLNDPLVSWFVLDQVQANTLVFVLSHLRCVRQTMVIRKLGFESSRGWEGSTICQTTWHPSQVRSHHTPSLVRSHHLR